VYGDSTVLPLLNHNFSSDFVVFATIFAYFMHEKKKKKEIYDDPKTEVSPLALQLTNRAESVTVLRASVLNWFPFCSKN